jgi:tripartite-type tricarboxylate transporter receptor subunit TctC
MAARRPGTGRCRDAIGLIVQSTGEERMNRSLRSLGVASAFSVTALVALTLAPAASAQQWKPTKPITIIVPWAAGGSTDQVTRVTAGEIEKAIGQKVIVVNQPGASGSIGTKNALEAAKDGYTWTAGAAQDLGTYAVLGMLDTKIGDWALFLNVANVSTLSVNPSTPYKTASELIDAMKAKPGAISVATAGVNSSGHSAMEAIAKATGVKYKHVTYDGGNPAVVSTVAGETDATSQLTVEQAEMIRGKRLRALAVIGDKPVELDGYGVIEPLTKSIPGFKSPANYFGIFIPKGVPPEVIATVEKIWADQIATSATLKQYATSRGAQFAPYAGAEAQKAVMPAVQANAWAAADTGKAKVAPDTLGIPRP